MRSLSILLTFGVLGALGCSHGPAPARQATPVQTHPDTARGASGRQQAPEPGAPKPYNQVITAGAVTDSGVFVVDRIGEKLFYQIPKAVVGRAVLLVADPPGTIRGGRAP